MLFRSSAPAASQGRIAFGRSDDLSLCLGFQLSYPYLFLVGLFERSKYCSRRDELVVTLSILLYDSPRAPKQARLLFTAPFADEVSVGGTFAPDAVIAPGRLAVAVFVSFV